MRNLKTLDQMLDALADEAGSDRKIGPLVGASLGAVTMWRTGRAFPDDEKARRMAKLLGLDERYVVAVIHSERAKTPESRSMWQSVAQAFGTVLVTVGAITAIGVTPTPAEAAGFNNNGIALRSGGSTGGNASASGQKYTLRRNRRRKGAASAFAAMALAALGLGAPRLRIA